MQCKIGICRKSAKKLADFTTKKVILNQICNFFTILISSYCGIRIRSERENVEKRQKYEILFSNWLFFGEKLQKK